MWSTAAIIGTEPCPEGQHTLLLQDAACTPNHSTVLARAILQSGLDHVEWQGEEGCSEPRDSGGEEAGAEGGLLHVGILGHVQRHYLQRLVVAGQHAHIHRHPSQYIRGQTCTSKQLSS